MLSENGPLWNRTVPEATKVIQDALKERLAEEIKALTATTEFQEECHTLAKQMVNEIRNETHRKIVDEVSSRLAGLSVGGYGMGLRGMIEQVIIESMQQ